MNSGREPLGFTIIEVLIVLAIGSFLFIAAAAALTGDQKQTEFDTGARQIFSQLQSVSSNVQNGNYSKNTNYTCTTLNSNAPVFSNSQKSEGSNYGCVYIGEAIQFSPSGNSSLYYIYSLVGDQFGSGLNPPTLPFPYSATVLDSTPVVASSTYPPPGTQVFSLPDQFVVSKITYPSNPSGDSNDIIGFYNVQSSSLSTNSSSLGNETFIIPEASNISSQSAVTDINADTVDTNGTATHDYDTGITKPVTVCFTSVLERNQAVNVSFSNQSNSSNLTLNYSYTGC